MLDLKRQYQPLHAELLDVHWSPGDYLKRSQFISGEPVAGLLSRRRSGQLAGVKHAIGLLFRDEMPCGWRWLLLALARAAPS